jgi:N-acetylmuramoyl-L-alanine amidase
MKKVSTSKDAVNIRELPNVSSDALGVLRKNETLDFKGYTPTHNGFRWAIVIFKNKTGYIREDVISVTGEDSLTFVLDPGHGGLSPKTQTYVTSGKRSPKFKDGSVYFEGVGNRQIAKRVGDKLKALGISYAYAVNPDEWQDVALGTRVSRVNLLHAKTPCVLISIHSNAAGNGKDWHAGEGYEVFTSPGQNKSDEYASIWFDEMKKEFPTMKGRSDLKDGDHDKEERFTMLGTKCPAFLIEMAFHTNVKEVELLRTPAGQERMADVIVRTIQKINANG